MSRTFLRPLAYSVGLAILANSAPAQSLPRNPENIANWKLANRFTTESLRPFLYSSNLTPSFINKTDRFWYSWRDGDGIKFWHVDPAKKEKKPLFDVDEMAAKLTELRSRPYDRTNLPITTLTFDEKNDNIFRFTVEQDRFEYDLEKQTLKALPRSTAPAPGGEAAPGGRGGRGGQGGGQGGPRAGAQDFKNYSPDRKAYVYAQDHNLYYVEVTDGKDGDPVKLTTDGVKDYSFGAQLTAEELRERMLQFGQQGQTPPPTSRDPRVRANVTWSKDSKRFYVMRSDSRRVKDLFLVNSLSMPRPTLMTYKYAMPGDTEVTQLEMHAWDPASKTLKRLPIEKYKDHRIFDVHWQDKSSDHLRFVRRDRLQRNLELCEMNLVDQSIKVLLTEKTEFGFLETQNVRYVKPGGDFIWFSERNGWGHYYLYENDGTFKRPITQGPWRANNIVELKEDKGDLYFLAYGREVKENPYYGHLYRIGLDGKGLTLLDPGNADHSSSLAPSGKFVVDSASRIDMPTQIHLRDDEGKVMMKLEEMDMNGLIQAGFQLPTPFVVKAADGVTDIYGNMWRPSDFNPKRKYPIIANVYPGPQTESVSSTFSAASTNQRLAQLGFIVIQIGNRGGNPARSNAYHSYGYFNLRDYGLADKKFGIEQLAQRHSFIDVDRVGIYGHSGGGFMTGAALLQPPYNDFFKVGVSSAGNHDNNVYNQNWSEQHHGLREVPVSQTPPTGRTQTPEFEWDGSDEQWLLEPQSTTTETKFDIKVPTNHELAANLKGKLLLVHGDMDNNVHPVGTVRLVDALIKANKRFDFMIMPGKAHGFGPMQGYFTQMLMEYFAEHLLGDYYRSTAEIRPGG